MATAKKAPAKKAPAKKAPAKKAAAKKVVTRKLAGAAKKAVAKKAVKAAVKKAAAKKIVGAAKKAMVKKAVKKAAGQEGRRQGRQEGRAKKVVAKKAAAKKPAAKKPAAKKAATKAAPAAPAPCGQDRIEPGCGLALPDGQQALTASCGWRSRATRRFATARPGLRPGLFLACRSSRSWLATRRSEAARGPTSTSCSCLSHAASALVHVAARLTARRLWQARRQRHRQVWLLVVLVLASGAARRHHHRGRGRTGGDAVRCGAAGA